MYKIPEDRRLTTATAKRYEFISKQILELISFENNKEDGYFFLPKVNATGNKLKGGFFLCRATVVEGWRVVAVNIPHEGRSATWEELDWVKSWFWDKGDSVIAILPPNNTYVGGNRYWVHLWQPVSTGMMAIPPIFNESFPFRKSSAFRKLFRKIREGLFNKEPNFNRFS